VVTGTHICTDTHTYTHIYTDTYICEQTNAVTCTSNRFPSVQSFRYHVSFTELLDMCRSRDGEPPLDSRATPLKHPNHSNQSKPVSVTATLPLSLSLSLDSYNMENESCVDTRTCLRHRTYRHQRYKRGYLTSVLRIRHFVEQDN
jgi:hypothetical protein